MYVYLIKAALGNITKYIAHIFKIEYHIYLHSLRIRNFTNLTYEKT